MSLSMKHIISGYDIRETATQSAYDTLRNLRITLIEEQEVKSNKTLDLTQIDAVLAQLYERLNGLQV